MATHCSPGDRVVCKIKNDEIANVYDDKSFEKKEFDIAAIHNNGYLIYVPTSIYIKNTISITAKNYKQYGLDKKFIDSEVLFITDHNIVAICSRIDGMVCSSCMIFSPMAAANQPDGKFVCWNCTTYPFYK